MPRESKIPPAKRREWLELYLRGKPLDEIARRESRNPRTVTANIERARQERDFEVAQQEQLREALRSHQQDMLALLERLRGAVHIPPLDFGPQQGDFGLDDLYSSHGQAPERRVGLGPSLPTQDYSIGRHPIWGEIHLGESPRAITVIRDSSGPIEVHLTEEDSLLWRTLKEHLPRDPLWRDLADWQRALLAELQIGVTLNQSIRRKVEEVFGLQVTVGGAREPHLTPGLVWFIRVEATKCALGQPPTNIDDLVTEGEGSLLYQSSWILAEHLEDEGKAKSQLISIVEATVRSAEGERAVVTYRDLEDRTQKARNAIEEYLLLHHIPGRCRLCKKLGGQ